MKDIISEDEFNKLSLEEQKQSILDLLPNLTNEELKTVYEEMQKMFPDEFKI